MNILEFLENQTLGYYGVLISIFLIISMIIVLILTMKFEVLIKNATKTAIFLSVISIILIIWLSNHIYNDYVSNFVSKPTIGSEIELDLSDLNPIKGIEKGIMDFFKINYDNIKNK